MSDGESPKRVVARVVSTLGQTTQFNTILSDVADVCIMTILEAVKVEVPAEPRGHRMLEWCASTETSAALKQA